jgi:hypothetical protein
MNWPSDLFIFHPIFQMHDNIILMSRQQRSEKSVEDIANRFIKATKNHLKMNSAELSRLLGYANPSTVQSVTKGRSLPDFVRLAEHQSELRNANGQTLNLHWVITGEGEPMIEPPTRTRTAKPAATIDDDIYIQIKKLKPVKKAALVKFLSAFS